MKTSKFLSMILLAMASLAFFGCEKGPQTEIVLGTDEYNIDGNGGSVEISYQMNPVVEGILIIPQCTADWITDLNAADGVISFEVAENMQMQARDAIIEITAGSKKNTVFIAVHQMKCARQVFEVNGVTFNMRYVMEGSFTMGGTEEQGDDAFYFELPVHKVTLSSYYIGETEVTQGLWEAVMGENPSEHAAGSSYPVEMVSWNDIQTFLEKLNALTGKTFTLPTEAQWEFAARGGNASNHTKYSGSANLDEVAWYGENSGDATHPVAMKKANELGIYDMSGNVYEWCSDWYTTYKKDAVVDPVGPENGLYRVYRGGALQSKPQLCRTSYRFNNEVTLRDRSMGFRLALAE